jgi:hypothetical protein
VSGPCCCCVAGLAAACVQWHQHQPALSGAAQGNAAGHWAARPVLCSMLPVLLVAGVARLHDEHGTGVQQVIKQSPDHQAMR